MSHLKFVKGGGGQFQKKWEIGKDDVQKSGFHIMPFSFVRALNYGQQRTFLFLCMICVKLYLNNDMSLWAKNFKTYQPLDVL